MGLHFLENSKVPRYKFFIRKGFQLTLTGMDHSNDHITTFLWLWFQLLHGASSFSVFLLLVPRVTRGDSQCSVSWLLCCGKKPCRSFSGAPGPPWLQQILHFPTCPSFPYWELLEGALFLSFVFMDLAQGLVPGKNSKDIYWINN
jgi:hypothetical protein